MSSRVSPLLVAAIIVAIAESATAQSVTYSLGPSTDLLDANFYAGGASTFNNSEPAIGVPRIVANFGVNNAGTRALFWAYRLDTNAHGLFMVNIGDPSSWVRLLPDRPVNWYVVSWAPDDTAVFFGDSKYTLPTQDTVGILVEPYTNHGYSSVNGTITRKAANNWLVRSQLVGDPGQIIALPILPSGVEDTTRTPVIVANIGLIPTAGILFPYVSNQGDAVAFSVIDPSPPAPDVSDVYLLKNLDLILAAPKIGLTDISSLAPTSLSDPNIVDIRASDSTNFVGVPSFSQDGSLVFYAEDYNNVFDFTNHLSSVAAGAWDNNLAQLDGTGDLRFNLPGTQYLLKAFPSGNRLHYINDWHVFATRLIVESDFGVGTVSLPEVGTNSTTVGGNPVTVPFILTDSAVATTTPATVVDATGMTINLPIDQVINFPTGTVVKKITASTPVFPVTNIQLPDPNTSIPVIRSFGPSGTQFDPPITITIPYTDGEVAGLADVSDMIPYLFNSGSGQYEPLAAQFLPTVVVDTLNKTLSFQTDHFSNYGIGSPKAVLAPQRPWTWGILVAALTLAGGMLLAKRKRIAASRVSRWVGCVAAIAGIVVTGIAGNASAQSVTYSLGPSTDLLDANFYAGGASTFNNSEPAIGVPRLVVSLGVNNAGTEAAFMAIR